MTVALWLEPFGDEQSATSAPSPDYERGYAEGNAAARAEALEDATRLNDQLVQTVADINFTYAEARSQVMQSLRPLFQTITVKVLPHCVENGFAGQVVDALMQIAPSDTEGLSIYVHPNQVASVKAVLGDVSIAADPNLTDYAAWIGHDGHETLLDVDGLLARIAETLAALHTYQEDDAQHG